jgi:hypothetical protein
LALVENGIRDSKWIVGWSVDGVDDEALALLDIPMMLFDAQ